jgi:hypothetical protein
MAIRGALVLVVLGPVHCIPSPRPSTRIPWAAAVRELDGRRLQTRIKGRDALERRIRGVLIAVHRFARLRATTRADLTWSAQAIDGLTATLTRIAESRDGDNERRTA